MKPASFDYIRPTSISEALSLLAKHGPDSRPLAGGQSLTPMLHMRLARPSLIVDLNALPELSEIKEDDGKIHVGALTRYSQIQRSPLIRRRLPLLFEAICHIGDRMIRNRGTIGGSLAHADPSAELPLVALAMEATVTIACLRGLRTIAASTLFTGPYQTSLNDDELITDTVWPSDEKASSIFLELTRRHGDFPVISVAAYGLRGPDNLWTSINLALGGVSNIPFVCKEASRILAGSSLTSEDIDTAASACLSACNPVSDTRASKKYRTRVLPVYVRRALQKLHGTQK